MSDQRAFRGVWIPADIWMSRELSLQEKVMLVEIDSLQHPEKGCFKSNKQFAEFFQLSPNRVSEIISSLAKKGLVRVEQIRSGKQIVERRIFMAQPFEKPKRGIREVEGGCSENRENPDRHLEEGYSENCEERGSGFRGTPTHTPQANDSDHAQGAGAQFDTGLDDSGQPLTGPADAPRKFPMSLDWEPSPEVFAAACLRAGLAPGSGYERPQLAKFTAHFADQPGRRHSESTWVANFVDWIRRDIRFAAQQPSAGGNRNAHTPRNAGGKRRRSAAEARRDAEQQRAEQAGGNSTQGGHVFEGEYSSHG